MKIFLYFFFILIIFYFLYYTYIIFLLFQKENQKEYENVLKDLIEHDLFDQIINNNNSSRVLINGVIDSSVLNESLEIEKNKLKEINLKLSQQNFDEEYNNLINTSEILIKNNEELNKELSSLKTEFDKKTGKATALTKLLKTSFVETKPNDLLHYLYKDIKF